MKIRTFLIALAVVGLGLGAVPQAQAAPQGVAFVFTAGATVSKDHYAPGVGPSAAGAKYNFSTVNAGIGGQKACIGVNSAGSVDQSCDLASTGTVLSGAANLGAFCGYSSGKSDTASGNIAGTTLTGVTIEWPQSAGTVLPLIYRNAANAVIGVGAVQTTGAAPGTCGLVGGATRTFAVSGWSVLGTL